MKLGPDDVPQDTQYEMRRRFHYFLDVAYVQGLQLPNSWSGPAHLASQGTDAGSRQWQKHVSVFAFGFLESAADRPEDNSSEQLI